MPLQINTTKKMHPFTQGWSNVQKNLHQKKWQIINACGWSERTFNNKINNGMLGKLKLKQTEIEAIAQVLELDENEILNYQKN